MKKEVQVIAIRKKPISQVFLLDCQVDFSRATGRVTSIRVRVAFSAIKLDICGTRQIICTKKATRQDMIMKLRVFIKKEGLLLISSIFSPSFTSLSILKRRTQISLNYRFCRIATSDEKITTIQKAKEERVFVPYIEWRNRSRGDQLSYVVAQFPTRWIVCSSSHKYSLIID